MMLLTVRLLRPGNKPSSGTSTHPMDRTENTCTERDQHEGERDTHSERHQQNMGGRETPIQRDTIKK